MEYQCSVCNTKVSGDLMVYKKHTEQHIIDLLKHDHPEWIEDNGLCKKCYEYYSAEIKGSVFKDAPCALRIRKIKQILKPLWNLFQKK